MLADDDVRDIRKQISNVLQPLFEDMGFDVDVDIEDGINIKMLKKEGDDDV